MAWTQLLLLLCLLVYLSNVFEEQITNIHLSMTHLS